MGLGKLNAGYHVKAAEQALESVEKRNTPEAVATAAVAHALLALYWQKEEKG